MSYVANKKGPRTMDEFMFMIITGFIAAVVLFTATLVYSLREEDNDNG